jgi:hypothetical protein
LALGFCPVDFAQLDRAILLVGLSSGVGHGYRDAPIPASNGRLDILLDALDKRFHLGPVGSGVTFHEEEQG